MIDDASDLGEPLDPVGAAVIPFPQLRANRQLTEAWRKEVEGANKSAGHKYRFDSPLAAIDDIFRQRGMPHLSMPAGWPELGRRVRTYPKDLLGIVGSQGGGKTSFAIQLAIANTADGTPVVWAPWELDATQISTRIVANMHAVHSMGVRDNWTRERIEHALVTVADMWHFVDRVSDPEEQNDAMKTAVAIAWKIYRRPPLLVVDHVGKMATRSSDIRIGTLQALEVLRKLAVDLECFVLALSQGSRGSQSTLTGKVDHGAAADAIGVAAESKSFEDDCASVVALAMFKTDHSSGDQAPFWDSHALVGKARWTGLEGKVGMRFHKPGGVWKELDYLPATPGEIKAAAESDKRDQHRTAPRSVPEVRADLNAARSGDAAASRRHEILEAIRRHGMIGMHVTEIRKIRGAGRGPAVHQALQELERAGSVERITGNKWRAATGRIE